MREVRRQRLVALAGLAGAIFFVVLGLAQGYWQVVVMAALLGLVSLIVLSARGPALETWSYRMEHSWFGVIVGLVAAALMWGFAVIRGGAGPWIALIVTITALGRAALLLRRESGTVPPPAPSERQ